jgi:hypothetical protein
LTPPWDEACTPAEARAVLEALGILDHNGSVVVTCTPVGPCRWVEDLRGLCLTLGMLATRWPLTCARSTREDRLHGRWGSVWCEVGASYVRRPTGGRCPEDGSFGWVCRTWGGLSTLVEDRCT